MATAQQPLTEAEMRSHFDVGLRAWNDHDIDGILEGLTDDVLWIEPGLHVRGKEAVAADLKDRFQAFPDLHIPVEGVQLFTSIDPPMMAYTWSATMTNLGSRNGVPATGRKLSFSGVTVYTLRDGLVSERRMTYDSLDVMQQLGVLPKSDGFGFKTVALINLMVHRDRKALRR